MKSEYCSIRAKNVQSKSETKDGVKEEIKVAEITGGYVVTVTKSGYNEKNEEYKDDGMSFYSKYNPLEGVEDTIGSMEKIIKNLS